MSDEKTAEKPTVKFEPPPKWAEQMFSRVHESMSGMEARIETRLDASDEKLDKAIHGLTAVTNEVERVKKEFYEHRGETLARFDAGSMRVKAITISNEEQDQQIANLSESQLAKLVKDAAKTPMGQKIVMAAGAVILALLSLAGIVISMQASKLQSAPAPAIVAPAPPVTK